MKQQAFFGIVRDLKRKIRPEQEPLEQLLRSGAHVWLFSLIFSTFLAEVLALLLIVAWLLQWRFRRMPLEVAMLIFLTIRLFTIATAIAPAASLYALRKIPFLLVYFPLAHIVRQYGAQEAFQLLRTLVRAGIAVAAYGLLHAVTSSVWRLASTTSGATTLAMFLAVVFSTGLCLIDKNKLQPRFPWLIGNAMMLLALALTRCRAPWMAALLVSPFVVQRRRRNLLLLSIVAFGIVVLLPGFRARIDEVLHWPPQLGDRPVIWKAGWELVQQRPILGYGPESFALLFHQRQDLKDKRVGAWHNFILQLWIESGLLGVAAFVIIITLAFYPTRKGGKCSIDEETQTVRTALRTGFAALLLAALFGGLIGDPIMDMLLWGLLGMIAGIAERNSKGALFEDPKVTEQIVAGKTA